MTLRNQQDYCSLCKQRISVKGCDITLDSFLVQILVNMQIVFAHNLVQDQDRFCQNIC